MRRVSGARMHAAFYRPNEIDWTGLNYQFFLDVALFTRDCFKSLTEIYAVLTTNSIWRSRLVGVGSINYSDAISYSVSGPVIRSVGVRKRYTFLQVGDICIVLVLSLYSFVGKRGDSYDRFLIRVREMYESINIIFQVLTNITSYKQSHVENPLNKTDFLSFSIYFTRYKKNN